MSGGEKCSKCSIKVSSNAKFCGGCGTPVAGKSSGGEVGNCPYCSKPLQPNDATQVGAEKWHRHCAEAVAKFKATKEVKANDIEGRNAEACPGCSQRVTVNQDRIVAAGKEWHKPCFEATQLPSKEFSNRIDEKNLEKCPGCKNPIRPNSGEQTVAGGKSWHRSCYDDTQAALKLKDNQVDQRNAESCPGCRNTIGRQQERIVSGGKEWHKTCFENTQIDSSKVRSAVSESNVEACPGCHKVLGPSDDRLVAAGKEWHRTCYYSS